jgi:hypothetical protein
LDINKAAGILAECVPAVRIIIERVAAEKRAYMEEQAEGLWIRDCTTRLYCHEESLTSLKPSLYKSGNGNIEALTYINY